MTPLLPALLYLSVAVFLIGMGWRWWVWLRTPVPLKIVLTPAPQNASGVVRRLAEEILGFRSVFEADRLLWIPAWLFHVSLLWLLAGHVCGLVIPDYTESFLLLDDTQFERLAQVAGSIVGGLAFAALLCLLLRRLAAERLRWISTFSDYFALVLLLLILGTGNHLRFMGGLDLAQARAFVSGWLALRPVAAPANPVFLAHVLFVSALLIFIPFSKLVHLGGGALFSPTLNQRNDPRERRHLNPREAVRSTVGQPHP